MIQPLLGQHKRSQILVKEIIKKKKSEVNTQELI